MQPHAPYATANLYVAAVKRNVPCLGITPCEEELELEELDELVELLLEELQQFAQIVLLPLAVLLLQTDRYNGHTTVQVPFPMQPH